MSDKTQMVAFPRELSDDLAELIAEKARVCGGGAFDIWEAICEKFGQVSPAAEISDDEILKLADQAFGQVVDYDLRGNPITDYRVLTIGAYGPALRRIVALARQYPIPSRSIGVAP